jgi:hypothetical protein
VANSAVVIDDEFLLNGIDYEYRIITIKSFQSKMAKINISVENNIPIPSETEQSGLKDV